MKHNMLGKYTWTIKLFWVLKNLINIEKLSASLRANPKYCSKFPWMLKQSNLTYLSNVKQH